MKSTFQILKKNLIENLTKHNFILIIIIFIMENDDLNLTQILSEPQMQICKLKYEGKTYRDIQVLVKEAKFRSNIKTTLVQAAKGYQ